MLESEFEITSDTTLKYDGRSWHLDKNGYYHGHTGHRGPAIMLHKYVWLKYNPEVPKGHVIHHVDGNRRNNEITNLKLLSHRDHDQLHKCGMIFSDEHRRNLSIAGMGHKVSAKTKAKIKAARSRQVFTAETRARMSAAQKRRYERLRSKS